MTNKEFLSQAIKLNKRIQEKELRLKTYKDLAKGSGQSFSEMPPNNTNEIKSKVESWSAKIINLEDELAEDYRALDKARYLVSEAIRSIGEGTLESVLELRYWFMLDWKDVVYRLPYSRDYVFQLHREAVSRVRL